MYICWGVANIDSYFNSTFILNLIAIILGSLLTIAILVIILRLIFDKKFRSKFISKKTVVPANGLGDKQVELENSKE